MPEDYFLNRDRNSFHFLNRNFFDHPRLAIKASLLLFNCKDDPSLIKALSENHAVP